MPHQCVRCSTMYDDGASELLKGCNCGSRFFFYVKKKDIETAKQLTVDLKPEERLQIEKDVKEIIGETIEDDKPVILDLETIRLMKPGKYELDIVSLFRGKPLIYKLEEGKYFIDLASSFKKGALESSKKDTDKKTSEKADDIEDVE